MKLPRGIRQRGPSFMVDVTVDGQRRTATCATLDEALTKRQELLALAKAGPVVPTWSLTEALDATRRLPPPVGWKGARSEIHLVMNARAAVKFFGGETPLGEITVARLDEYGAYLESEGNSDATINLKLAALSKLMTVARAHGGLVGKPSIPRVRYQEADLSEYDLSGFKPAPFEFEKNAARVEMRLPPAIPGSRQGTGEGGSVSV